MKKNRNLAVLLSAESIFKGKGTEEIVSELVTQGWSQRDARMIVVDGYHKSLTSDFFSQLEDIEYIDKGQAELGVRDDMEDVEPVSKRLLNYRQQSNFAVSRTGQQISTGKSIRSFWMSKSIAGRRLMLGSLVFSSTFFLDFVVEVISVRSGVASTTKSVAFSQIDAPLSGSMSVFAGFTELIMLIGLIMAVVGVVGLVRGDD